MVAVAEKRSRLNAQKGRTRSSSFGILQWFQRNSRQVIGGEDGNTPTLPLKAKRTRSSSSNKKQEGPKKIIVTPTKPKKRTTRSISTVSRLLGFVSVPVAAACAKTTNRKARASKTTTPRKIPATRKVVTPPAKKPQGTKHSIRRKHSVAESITNTAVKSTSGRGSCCLAIAHALQDEVHAYFKQHPNLTKKERHDVAQWAETSRERLERCDEHLLQQLHEQDNRKLTAEMKKIQTEIESLKQECMDMDVRAEASRFLYQIDAQRR